MISVSRFVASFVGACLVAAPAAAQEQAISASPDFDVPSAETTWHLRAALNVAALACRGDTGDDTVLLYNAMLRNEQAPLAKAAAESEQVYKTRFAGQWQDVQDTAMTRLYNFFASQNGHDRFCAAAYDVLREAVTVEPSSFSAFAATALPRLQAPFAAPPSPQPPVAIASLSDEAPVARMKNEVGGGRAPNIEVAYNGPR